MKRPNYAKVRAQDRNGEWFEAEGEELIARCFCHELDHLDGIVYTEVTEAVPDAGGAGRQETVTEG